MRLEYAVLIAGGMIALATWDKSGNARRSELCGRLIDKLPVEFIVEIAKGEDALHRVKSAVSGIEEQLGVTLAECRK